MLNIVLFSQHFQAAGSLLKPATADDQRGGQSGHGPLIGLVRPRTINPPISILMRDTDNKGSTGLLEK